jgi:IS30 family transposase
VAMNQYKLDERRKQVASLLAKSMTERQIAAQLNISQSTINRDIQALKEMSQQFVYDLARSDLAYFYKQPIDGLDAVKEEAWAIYHSNNMNIQIKDRLAALRLIKDCNIDKFELLNAGPSVLNMKTMEQRLSRIETSEVFQ